MLVKEKIDGKWALPGGYQDVNRSVRENIIKEASEEAGAVVNPNKIYSNNTGKPGDRLILTKRLGVGIICTAARIGEADEDTLNEAIDSMRTLNKYACDISKKYDIHACTDITGFGFLGHLMEMMGDDKSCEIYAKKIPVF